MTPYYDRQGKPIDDTIAWAKLFEDPQYKIVEQTYTKNGKYWVSTVWLGMDHNFGQGKPIIFETMVFPANNRGMGDAQDSDQERYSTEAEAIKGHKAMVKKWELL